MKKKETQIICYNRRKRCVAFQNMRIPTRFHLFMSYNCDGKFAWVIRKIGFGLIWIKRMMSEAFTHTTEVWSSNLHIEILTETAVNLIIRGNLLFLLHFCLSMLDMRTMAYGLKMCTEASELKKDRQTAIRNPTQDLVIIFNAIFFLYSLSLFRFRHPI